MDLLQTIPQVQAEMRQELVHRCEEHNEDLTFISEDDWEMIYV